MKMFVMCGPTKYISIVIFITFHILALENTANGNTEEKNYDKTNIYVRPKVTASSLTTQNSVPYQRKRISHSKIALPVSVGNPRRLSSHKPKVLDRDWLLRNITSLWKFMRHIKRDLKQLKKQTNWRKGSHQTKINKNIDSKHKKKETVEEIECDKSWFRPHPNLCKSSDNATVCEGNGNCVCGQCQCESPHYGEFCQCNDMSCQRFEGELCGGVRNGQCRCSKCLCRPNFSGPICECSTETHNCNKDGKTCSNRGSCLCNSCQCADGFTGSLCEEDIYSAYVCESMKPCVLCQAYGINHHKCDNCNLKIKTVGEVTGDNKKTCVYFYRGCFLKYSYTTLQTEGEPMTVYTSEKLNCD